MKTIVTFVCVLCCSVLFSQSVHIQVLSAVEKDKKISDAQVILQKNGEASFKASTNTEGKAVINSSYVDDASTLLIIKKEGYSDLVVKGPCDGMTYALSPIINSIDGMRIVLSWGATPKDLDSHLTFPENNIYFDAKEGDDANLDVDDTDSYGPETITIKKKKFGQVYSYFVHDYTNKERMNSKELSNSQAKVFVYVGQTLMKTYYVPVDKVGNAWYVFNINGNGEIEDVNRMRSITSEQAGIQGDDNATDGDDETDAVVTIGVDIVEAKHINLAGDKAYKSGDIDGAIELYKKAIDLYPTYAQAYSNLGLMYAKKGRDSEAIFSNRKAITYTSSSTTKAAAYYNNARLFEKNGEYQEALNSYELAKSHKQNVVYDNAIARVRAKL